MKGYPDGALGRRDDLNPYPSKTDGDYSEALRCNADLIAICVIGVDDPRNIAHDNSSNS